MRARHLLLLGASFGVISVLVALAVDAAGDPPDPTGDASMFNAAFVLGGLTGLVLLGVLAFVAGWFGRDRDDPALVAFGLAGTTLVALVVVAVVSAGRPLAVVVTASLYALIAWVTARVAFAVGDMICDIRGLPTMRRLTAPAFPDESLGGAFWTTEAGPAIRQQLKTLSASLVPAGADGPGLTEAKAVGIRVALPRDSAVLVALLDGRLAIQTISLTGDALGDPTVLAATDLREVSIRSEAADGSIRRQINAYDDLVDVLTTSGARLRLRLPYGTRGAGTTTGGPEVIRAWLRTSATTYR